MKNVSRRGFVLGGAALAAVTKSGAQTQAQPARAHSAGVQLGLASYSFRKFSGGQLIRFCKQLRVDHVNLKDVHLPMGTPEEVKAKADAYRAAGLVITGGGTISFPKDDDADVKAKFDYARAAGFPMIVAAPTHESVERVAHFAAQYDIRVAIHNHGPEDKQFPSPLDVLKAVAKLDRRMGCCVDVGHTMRSGTDVVEALKAAGPRLFDLHMKDLAEHNVKESQVAVGEGIMPVRAIFAQLERMGYRGYVDLEYEIMPDDPLPGAIESFAYQRGVLAGMA